MPETYRLRLNIDQICTYAVIGSTQQQPQTLPQTYFLINGYSISIKKAKH